MSERAYAFLALGGGVQSGTMVEMVVEGELPRPTAVLFADTGAEAPWTYRYVDYLQERLARVGVPLWRVQAGRGLLVDMFDSDLASHPLPPFFVRNSGGVGRLRRQCTVDYKVEPIRRRIREFLATQGLAQRNTAGALYVLPEVTVEVWLGITVDEAERMKDSGVKWIVHRFPLVEKGMRRSHCIAWLEEHGLPVPAKSACIICPYHRDVYWRELRENHPHVWKRVVDVDARLRVLQGLRWQKVIRGEGPFIHPSCLPIEEALERISRQGVLFDLSELCDGGYCFV